ncbi:hypothetical protein P8452_51656 [Trifolium repens]|nr:hypothetical protein P8452_51656 [Trifolium repens]
MLPKTTPGKHRMGKQRRQRRQRRQPVGLGRLAMLCKLKSSLDAKFIEELKSSKGLFKFLFVHEADILIPLVQKLLKYFDLKYNTFEINGHKMGITLQDVLFLCHLPINGKPVIVDLCPTDVAFRKVFGEDSRERKGCVGAAFLTMIARDIDRSLDQRKIATLLVIIRSVIMPSLNGTRISTSFVELLENLDGVSDYAWGAALLAFLFNGIEKFLLRTDTDTDSPRLHWVIENLSKISQNHILNYEKVDKLLENLSDEDITWSPYIGWKLPGELELHAQLASRVSPLFCHNHVVHHKPYVVKKQFGYGDVDIDSNVFSFVDYKITPKDNRGQFTHNYFEYYKKELKIWSDCICFDDYLAVNNWQPIARISPSSSRRKCRKINDEEHGVIEPAG